MARTLKLAHPEDVRRFTPGPMLCLRCFAKGVESFYKRGERCPFHENEPETVRTGTVTIVGIDRKRR